MLRLDYLISVKARNILYLPFIAWVAQYILILRSLRDIKLIRATLAWRHPWSRARWWWVIVVSECPSKLFHCFSFDQEFVHNIVIFVNKWNRSSSHAVQIKGIVVGVILFSSPKLFHLLESLIFRCLITNFIKIDDAFLAVMNLKIQFVRRVEFIFCQKFQVPQIIQYFDHIKLFVNSFLAFWIKFYKVVFDLFATTAIFII